MATDLITVVGAGAFGLACAFVLARRGAAVRVIDRAGPGAGASGGHVGALAPHVPEMWNGKKAFQLDSLLGAEAFWADVARIGGGDPGYARLGRVQPLADAAAVALARARGDSAAALWQGRAAWRVTEAADLGPLIPASPTGLYVHDTLSARVSPRAGCAALVAALGALGVAVETDPDHPETPRPGMGRTLWATGAAGLVALGAGVGIKGQSALLAHDARGAPQVFAEGLHIVPHADGTVAIGSTTERDATTLAPDAQVDALIARARAICPVLAGAPVIDRWAGLRPRAKSRAPLLGGWPSAPWHFVANGGFKIGFGMAPKVAEVMADLMLDGIDRIPAGLRLN